MALILVTAGSIAYADPATEGLIKASDVDWPPPAMPDGWEALGGLVIDDLANLSALTSVERATAATLKGQLEPLGIVSAADYSIGRTRSPMNVVTVRVFRFSDAQRCKAFFEKKYGYPGWEQHYLVLPDTDGGVSLDSTQMNKRIFRHGAIWITAHQLGEGSEHITAANYIIDQLNNLQ